MAVVATAATRAVARPLSAGEATGLLVYRNYLAYRRAWYIFASGFLEPVFYLFSIGVGVGSLVTGFEFNGEHDPVRRVRRAGHARRVGDERRRCWTARSTSSSS